MPLWYLVVANVMIVNPFLGAFQSKDRGLVIILYYDWETWIIYMKNNTKQKSAVLGSNPLKLDNCNCW